MKDENRTKADLIRELKSLRRKLARLEKTKSPPAADKLKTAPRQPDQRFKDLTQAYQKLAESEAKYRTLVENIPQNRALHMLSECNQVLVRADDEQKLLTDICRIIIEIGGHRVAGAGYREEDENKTITPAASAGDEDGALAKVALSWDENAGGQGPAGEAIRSGRPVLCRDSFTDPACERIRGYAEVHGLRSMIALPLIIDQNVIGALSICAGKRDAFNDEEIVLLLELAEDLSFGIKTIRERKKREAAEQALTKSEQRFRALIENSFDTIMILDDRGAIKYISPSVERVLGYDRKHKIFETSFEFIHPEDRKYVIGKFNESIKNPGAPSTIQLRVKHQKGNYIIVEGAGRSMFLDPEVEGFVINFRDVTERVEALKALRDSEERLSRIVETVLAGITIVDVEGRIVFANPEAEKILGIKKDEIIQRWFNDPAWKITAVDGGPFPDEELPFARVMKTGEPVTGIEHVIEHPDGTRKIISINGSPVRDQGGQLSGMVASLIDVTERKRMVDEIRQSEERYRRLIETSPDAIVTTDLATRVTMANAQALKLFGYESMDEVRGRSGIELVAPDHREKAAQDMAQTPAEKSSRSLEYTFIRKNGSRFPAEMSIAALTGPGAAPLGFLAVIRDVTERKRAENESQVSETRYRRLFEAARDGILILDAESGQIVDVNPFLVDLLGFPHEEFCGKRVWELGPFKDIVSSKSAFEELKIKEYIRYENLPLQTKDGRPIAVEFVSNVYLVDQMKVIQCNIRDITERRQAEEQMRIKDSAMASSINAIALTDKDGFFTYVNPSLLEIYGFRSEQEVIGKSAVEFWRDKKEAFAAYQEIREQGSWSGEIIARKKDGTLFDLDLSVSVVLSPAGEPVCMIAYGIDITERKRLERELYKYRNELEWMVEERTRELQEVQAELVRNERLAALGQLAGSIGHELLNPLGVIKNSSYFLNMVLKAPEEKIAKHLKIIDREVNRSKKIVTDLLSLTRTGPRQKVEIELARLLDQALEEAAIPKAITVKRSYQIDAPRIAFDPEQMRQVFRNLIINAVQALEDWDKEKAITVSVAADARELMVIVEDTGPGIPLDKQKKIFDPLFSTKTRGFGLGLTVCKQLVQVNGGKIEVESEPGQGAKFTVSLPLLGAKSGDEQ